MSEKSPYGDGFALMPWAEHFREGRMPNFPDSWIAVLPVIVAHANENREAWPGYARICALAQVSRTTLSDAITRLVDRGWIAKFARKTGKQTHNGYRLLWGTDFDSRHWIALHHDMIFSGVWGKMRPSDRKVYLMLRAFAWRGGHAIPDAMCGTDMEDCLNDVAQMKIYSDAQFLPAHVYDPAMLQNLSGLKERTFRDSFAWLVDNEMVIRTGGGDGLEDGFLMPFRPGRHAPDIEQKVEEASQMPAYAQASPGAKRSMTYALRRQRLNESGYGRPCRSPLEVQNTDKRQ